jgi:hypothetical protein
VAYVAQQQFRIVDDYKNWQMSHLNDLVLTDDFMDETLQRLREQDSAWNDVTPRELRVSLRGIWRNVGQWHLVSEGKNPGTTKQAVEAWSDVILEWVGEAIQHSKNVVALDVQLTDVSDTLVDLQVHQDRLQFIRIDLLEWQDEIDSKSDDQAISSQDHWEIISLVTRAADWNSGWDAVLEDAPAIGSAPSDYKLWLERVIPLVEQELQDLVAEIDILEHRFEDIEKLYQHETEQSRAVASTLVIESSADADPRVERVRPTGVMILVGGAMGLAVWAVWVFSKFNRRTDR